MENKDIKKPGEWQETAQTYHEGDRVKHDGQEWVCKEKASQIKNILFWGVNGFFTIGLLVFAVIFWLHGDTFHAIIDMLYLLIIVECLFLRRKHRKLTKEYHTLLEGSRVLIEQNAKMTETLRDINDPFRENREMVVNTSRVRMEVLTAFIKYEKSYISDCTNKEQQIRYKEIERKARKHLLNEIINTELVSVYHITDDEGMRRCVAEIIVGVKGDKNIEKIIHPNDEA